MIQGDHCVNVLSPCIITYSIYAMHDKNCYQVKTLVVIIIIML